jgi:hypothetical protein
LWRQLQSLIAVQHLPSWWLPPAIFASQEEEAGRFQTQTCLGKSRRVSKTTESKKETKKPQKDQGVAHVEEPCLTARGLEFNSQYSSKKEKKNKATNLFYQTVNKIKQQMILSPYAYGRKHRKKYNFKLRDTYTLLCDSHRCTVTNCEDLRSEQHFTREY